MSLLAAVPFLLIGYALGSVPSGLLVARIYGVDIRRSGSGNIGATNVLRTLGAGPAIVVVLLDPLKGAAAVALPALFGLDPWLVAATGLATVLGNDYNLFLNMRGGKGIATSIGVYLVIDPLATLFAMAVGLSTIALSRMVSLGSLVGMIAAPLFVLAATPTNGSTFVLAVLLAALALIRHRDNLQRLAAGSERRLGEARDDTTISRTRRGARNR